MIYGTLPPATAGIAHRFAAVRGLRFHYVAGGAEDAVPVVLLAGFPESWYAWRNVMPALSKDYRVFAIDLPGQGDSDRPLDGYDTRSVADRLHDLIAHLGLTRYALAAHDVGALVAFPYAHMFGEEIEALTVLGAGIPGVTLPDMLPTAPDKAWKTWHFVFHSVADLPEALIAGRGQQHEQHGRREAGSVCSGHSRTEQGLQEDVALRRRGAVAVPPKMAEQKRWRSGHCALLVSADQAVSRAWWETRSARP